MSELTITAFHFFSLVDDGSHPRYIGDSSQAPNDSVHPQIVKICQDDPN